MAGWGPNPSCVPEIEVERENHWRNQTRVERAKVFNARDDDLGNKYENSKEI